MLLQKLIDIPQFGYTKSHTPDSPEHLHTLLALSHDSPLQHFILPQRALQEKYGIQLFFAPFLYTLN